MPKPNQQNAPNIFGLNEKREAITALAFYPALTLMVFMRSRVGIEQLSLGPLYLMAFAMYLVDTLTNTHVSLFGGVQVGGHGLLIYFAVAFLALGLWQRRHRWQEIRSGRDWVYTLSYGESHFGWLPVRQDILYRHVDPALAFLIGLCVRNLGFGALGFWVMFASVCWRITEERACQIALKEFFAEGNNLLEARVRAKSMQQISGDGEPRPLTMRESGGVPTGIDHALAAVIAKRRKEADSGTTPETKGVSQ